MEAKSLNLVLYDEVDTGSLEGLAPRIDLEFFFDPSLPVYHIMSYAWIRIGSNWLIELMRFIMLNLSCMVGECP